MSEFGHGAPNPDQTNIVAINHEGGDQFFEYTYRPTDKQKELGNTGAQHLYKLNADTGNKDHIKHQDLLESQGYALTPDESGSYLLPNHPQHPDNKRAKEETPTQKLAQTANQRKSLNKRWSDAQLEKDARFFNSLGVFINENRTDKPEAKNTSIASVAKQESPQRLAIKSPQKSDQEPETAQSQDAFRDKFEDFMNLPDEKPERYQPRHAAEKRYKARLRRLGRPLINAWTMARAHIWNDEGQEVEDGFDQPVKPELSRKTSLEEQNRLYEADLQSGHLLKPVSLADYSPRAEYTIPETMYPIHPTDVTPKPDETELTTPHKRAA